MEPFYGTWKVQLDKNKGVAEIGKLLGWPEEKEKMISTLDYTMLIEPSGDQYRCLLDYGSIKMEFFFKLGEPFDFTGVDGTKAKCTATVEGGKMVESYFISPESKWQTVRELSGGTMTATTVFEGFPDKKCVQELVKKMKIEPTRTEVAF